MLDNELGLNCFEIGYARENSSPIVETGARYLRSYLTMNSSMHLVEVDWLPSFTKECSSTNSMLSSITYKIYVKITSLLIETFDFTL